MCGSAVCLHSSKPSSNIYSWNLRCFWSTSLLALTLFTYLYRPVKFVDRIAHITMFLNTLSPKFYVALTGTSSLISGLILVIGDNVSSRFLDF
ncbi:unnamed protein product [Trichobilharzia szidati]|nr:unnamed protein product [Trichobilharzia szidati]